MNYNEIESCVIRAKHGSQEDLLKILEQFKPFIFKTAQSFNIKSFDVYDLAQIGNIALINAVLKYRTGSHTFSSYAYNAIKNAFKQTARKETKFSRDFSLNNSLTNMGANSTEFIDCIESTENLEESYLRAEQLKEVRSAVAKLSEDELELVLMVYYNNVSLKTYAEKKNINYIHAVRKRNKILEKLGCLLEN
jgi:RNA polymerase sigma factor (sigma-70 family)